MWHRHTNTRRIPFLHCGYQLQTHMHTHTHLSPHDFKLVWTSELIHAGFRDLWFDYYGELPAVFALESCTSDTWPLTTHTVRHTCWLKPKVKHTHTHTIPSHPFICSYSFFERSHSWEGSHSDSVSDLAMLTCDYRDKRASHNLGSNTGGKK